MRWLIIGAVLALGIFYWLSELNPMARPRQTLIRPGQEAKVAPAPAARPRFAAGHPAGIDHKARLEQMRRIARARRVEIVEYKPSAGGATVLFQWQGESAGPGGGFTLELLREGLIRTMDEPGPESMGIRHDAQNRRIYWRQAKFGF